MAVHPRLLVRSIAAHHHILRQLVLRDISGRYQGSLIGQAWALLTPLLMLGVYVFVFGVVFNVRRGLANENMAEFAINLFCGVLIHGVFAEALVRAPTVLISQPSFVKKIVFPLEMLPLVPVGSALFHFLAGLTVLLLAAPFCGAHVGLDALALPLVLLPLLLISAGVSWIVAALAVYMRDIGQVTGLVATVLLFLSPVFYPASALPESLRSLILLNPLTIPIEAARDMLLRAGGPEWTTLGLYALAATVFAWLGFAFFQKTRGGFADVL